MLGNVKTRKTETRCVTAPRFVNSESDDIAFLRVKFGEIEDYVRANVEDNKRPLDLLEIAAHSAYRAVWTGE